GADASSFSASSRASRARGRTKATAQVILKPTMRLVLAWSDSCAMCHGRPRGSAGVGGNVATRPDSRDAPHLFGLGLREMLADEITGDLRTIRQQAINQAEESGHSVTLSLLSKGINYGTITATPSGTVVTSNLQ